MLGGEKGRERLRVCRGSRSPSQSDLVGIVSVPVKKVLELYLPYLAGLAFAINFSHWVGIGTAWCWYAPYASYLILLYGPTQIANLGP